MKTAQSNNAYLGLIADRVILISALHSPKYTIKAICGECRMSISLPNILHGFGSNPDDNTIQCSRCNARVWPTLRTSYSFAYGKMPFFGKEQVLKELSGAYLELYDPDTLCSKQPAVYRSALIHFGSLRRAFSRINVEYRQGPVRDWESRLAVFLGCVSPVVIAGIANVTVSDVKIACKTMGIVYQSPLCLTAVWRNELAKQDTVVQARNPKVRMQVQQNTVPDVDVYDGPSFLDREQRLVSRRTHVTVGDGSYISKPLPTLDELV